MGNSDYGTDVANQFDWDETKKLGAEPFSFDMNATYNPATHTWGSTHVDSGVGQGGGLPFTWGGGNSGTAIGAGAPGTTGTLGTTAGAVVPMTTPWWQSSTIPALINAAIAIKAMRDQGKKPNFYTAPQTPQDIWKEGKTRDLFDFSGAHDTDTGLFQATTTATIDVTAADLPPFATCEQALGDPVNLGSGNIAMTIAMSQDGFDLTGTLSTPYCSCRACPDTI